MNELQVKGMTKFMEIEIPNVYGGFGENQKCVLAKTIAEIHGQPLKKINELINNNLDEFEFGIDILNLMDEKFKVLAKDLGFITSNRQEYCYLLSEQGYMALVGLMRTDKAREIRKQFRREYFQMKEIINSNEQLKEKLVYKIYKGGQDGILASRQLVDLEVQEATKPLIDKIEKDEPLVTFAEQVLKDGDNILVRELAKLVSDHLNITIGEKKLYKKLREWKYICNHSTEPTQIGMNLEYFIVETKVINTPYGSKQVFTTYITPKGQVKIVEKLRKEINN